MMSITENLENVSVENSGQFGGNVVHEPPPSYSEIISVDRQNQQLEELEAFEIHAPRRPSFMDKSFTEAEVLSIRWMAPHINHSERYKDWKKRVMEYRGGLKQRGVLPDEHDEPRYRENPRHGSSDNLLPHNELHRQGRLKKVTVRIPRNVAGHIIGFEGNTVRSLATSSGVKIVVEIKDSTDPYSQSSWTLVNIWSASKEGLINAQLRLWKLLSKAHAATVTGDVYNLSVWHRMSDEDRANFQTDYSVAVTESNDCLRLATFTAESYVLAENDLENDPNTGRRQTEDIQHNQSHRTHDQDQQNMHAAYYNHHDSSPHLNSLVLMGRNLNRDPNNFNMHYGSQISRPQLLNRQENQDNYGYSNRDMNYHQDNQQSNAFGIMNKQFFVTVNEQVTSFLNTRDENNQPRIPFTVYQKFGVDMEARTNPAKPGFTLMEFIGPKWELLHAQDFVWNHLRTLQTKRTIMVDDGICHMWRNWSGWSRTLFTNKTNVTISTTDFKGELVLRAFAEEHLHKAQNFLIHYAQNGMLPENDLELSRKMWGLPKYW